MRVVLADLEGIARRSLAGAHAWIMKELAADDLPPLLGAR